MIDRRTRLATAFGRALDAQLRVRGATVTSLVDRVGRSASYLSQTMTGNKNVSPRLVEDVADALNLDPAARAELHRAAAIDHGFKLDLTERLDPDTTPP